MISGLFHIHIKVILIHIGFILNSCLMFVFYLKYIILYYRFVLDSNLRRFKLKNPC